MDGNPDRAAHGTGSDLDDLLAARDGDHDAGRRLVSRHGPAMVRTARRVLGRYASGDGEDVVQEAFIAALTTGALPQGDVGAWLRAVTARKALDALRGAARRGEQPLVFDAAGATGAEPSVEAGARLDVLALRQCLARLSPTDRAVLTLVDLEGQSMAEAAGALGLTRVAIRLRAVRARRKLARMLRAGRSETRRGRVPRGQEIG
jgi:RNA polymerase sigma-70 factor (ECF subfamily)